MIRLTLKHLITLFCSIPFMISAQDVAPDLITDRPDQTESSSVVPHRSLQIETGFLYESYTNYDGYAYNTTLLRYGMLDNIELRLGLEYLGENNNVSNKKHSGLSPLYLGFKIAVREEEDWKPEIAIMGGLTMPFTANEDFKPDYTAADMRLSFAHTLSENISLGYNVGVEWDGVSAIPAYNYSLVLGFTMIPRTGLFIESYGQIIEDNMSQHLLDGGFTYLIMDNFQFDCSAGAGISSNTLDYFLSAGLTYRLPN